MVRYNIKLPPTPHNQLTQDQAYFLLNEGGEEKKLLTCPRLFVPVKT